MRLQLLHPKGLLRKADLATGQPPYPVFRIPLGGYWTDFEIKASTNNFTGPAALVYYYQSWATDQHPTNPDTNAFVYFTDD